MKYSFLFRTRIIFFCISVFALILIGKLFLVQVVHSSDYSDRADRQYSTPSSNIFERGTIYFERKDGQLVSAAMQTTGFKLAINPTKILDKEAVYNELAKIITVNHDDFLAKVGKENDPYEEIANYLTKEQADAIALLKIPGLTVYKEKWRFYPGANLASQSLGFVAYKGDELGGRYGLEREYNGELSRNKDNPYINFFAEVFSNINDTLFSDKTLEGDVVTTIEPSVQSFLEKTLEGVKEKYNVDSIGGIIMNPQDGSIYALSTKPDFDLNNFSKVTTTSTFSNPLVENVFEFGSVVKPLVMAGALDAGVLTANTTYNDKGEVTIEKHQIFNFDKKGRGPNTTMQDVLTQSLNTGMVFVEQQLGKVKLRDYLLGYGIKDKTGIDLPNETSSLISNFLTSKREIEDANAAFGQGIALTPIEIVRALASLSNGGNLVVPHVVQKIKYNNGTEKSMTYKTTPTKISQATSTEITRMLVNAMDKNLGANGKLEHYSVAAKTGTAQVADSVNGGYYTDRHTHSFTGYFPAYDPKFIIFLYAINPKGVPYAIQTWGDPFLSITNFLINYYEVPPDR
ncbi:MAG: penicillin-binding protein 2 [Candidatus Nomurabacteria bacterium]|nr:penicillin-binding protein 2 [Candidatus Nomurabacteria bacterium]